MLPARRGRFLGLAVVAGAVYALMWFGWTLNWGWLTTLDDTALGAAHRIGVEYRGWVTFWDVWCNVLSPVSFRVLILGLAAYELIRRRLPAPGRTALFLILSVGLSGVVTELAKRLADRPRPATAMVDALSTSFPSGHAVGSMVAVLALAVVYLPRVRRSRWRWLMVVGAVVVVSVGVGRVALNVHNPSDVAAGWALGYLYVLVCLPVLTSGVRGADETPAAPGIAR